MIKYIDCKLIAQDLKDNVKSYGANPRLHVIQVGHDPASTSYIAGKQKDCEEVGIEFTLSIIEPENQLQVLKAIEYHIEHTTADGIIIQLPLPFGLTLEDVKPLIPRNKDVDGFTDGSDFIPCTPAAVMDIIESEFSATNLLGIKVTLLGRSQLVGKPLLNLLVDAGATITVCNSGTKEGTLKELCFTSDIVISCVGKYGVLTTDMFKEDCVVIDVGINRVNNKLCGDVKVTKDADIRLTPVPGGVGLLTRANLMNNVLQAYLDNEHSFTKIMRGATNG